MSDMLLAEKQVLGGLLLNSEQIPAVYDILTPDDFYLEGHRALYNHIVEIYSTHGTFNIDLLPTDYTTEATNNKLIRECAEVVLSINGTVNDAHIVKQYSNAMKALDIMESYAKGHITPQNVNEVLGNLIEKLTELSNGRRRTKLERTGEGMMLRFYERLFEKDKDKYRVMTGYKNLDNIMGGIWKSDMCVIAARPGVGKSAFAINIIERLLRQGKNVALYSFEMSKHQVLERLTSLMSGVELWRLRLAAIPDDKAALMAATAGILNDIPLYICDEAATISTIKAECRIRYIDVLVVDYLSLTPSETRNTSTYERVSELARGYKRLAQQLDIPVIVLAQLNRQTEGRGNNEPTMSDLRDSGEIEQAANQLILLFDWQDHLVVKVAKNRQGETGAVVMEFNKPVMKVSETDKEYKTEGKRGKVTLDASDI